MHCHSETQEPDLVNKSQIIKVAIAVILLITALVIIVTSLTGGGGEETLPETQNLLR